jgi:hypothetical protein
MLSVYKNYLFFEFATPVVQEFERLNSLFQQTKADPQEFVPTNILTSEESSEQTV